MSCLIPSSVSRGMGAQAHRGCSTCLREHAVAGTVLAAQEQVGVPDAEAAAYLRGVAAGYAQHADPQRVESVRTGPISHAVPVRSTAQVLVDVVAAAHSEFLLGQPLAPFRSCWKLGSRMLVWGWFIGLRGQPTLAGGLPGRRSQMRAKCSITGAVHSGPVGHGAGNRVLKAANWWTVAGTSRGPRQHRRLRPVGEVWAQHIDLGSGRMSGSTAHPAVEP
jgi:hypothetical protein